MTVTITAEISLTVKGAYDPGERLSRFTLDPADDSPDEFVVEGYFDDKGQPIPEGIVEGLCVDEDDLGNSIILAARDEYAKGLEESKAWEDDHPHREGE